MVRPLGFGICKALTVGIFICWLSNSPCVRAQQIAITFDDLPAHSSLPPDETRLSVATAVIKALKDAGVPPIYGFVNGFQAEQQPSSRAVLDAWRTAGYPLGNHSWSHMNLNEHPLDEFQTDVVRNESLLEGEMQGKEWRWFRFPYLAEGNSEEKRAGIRKFLAQRGYKIAGVTMSFGDYLWNEPYARCSAKNDVQAIASMESSYLAAAQEELNYARSLSHMLYGRDIPYVLLMHIGAFDARMLPRLLKMYKSAGATFLTLEEAEKDPFYREDTDLTLPPGPDTLSQALAARSIPLPKRPLATPQLNEICK